MEYHTFARETGARETGARETGARETGEPEIETDPFPLVAAAFLDDAGMPSAVLQPATQEPVPMAAQDTTAPVTETSATLRTLAPEARSSLRPGAGTRSLNAPDADWTQKLGTPAAP